jgi:hypothetical protein
LDLVTLTAPWGSGCDGDRTVPGEIAQRSVTPGSSTSRPRSPASVLIPLATWAASYQPACHHPILQSNRTWPSFTMAIPLRTNDRLPAQQICPDPAQWARISTAAIYRRPDVASAGEQIGLRVSTSASCFTWNIGRVRYRWPSELPCCLPVPSGGQPAIEDARYGLRRTLLGVW